MSSLLTQIIESPDFVRKIILEGALKFRPSSAADGLYKIQAALNEHYSNWLIYEFQLYSDRPKTVLVMDSATVNLDGAKFIINSLDEFTKLNGFLWELTQSVQFKFRLSPELTYLQSQIENTLNSKELTNPYSVSCPVGNRDYYSGQFEIEWVRDGFIVSSTSLSLQKGDSEMTYKL